MNVMNGMNDTQLLASPLSKSVESPQPQTDVIIDFEKENKHPTQKKRRGRPEKLQAKLCSIVGEQDLKQSYTSFQLLKEKGLINEEGDPTNVSRRWLLGWPSEWSTTVLLTTMKRFEGFKNVLWVLGSEQEKLVYLALKDPKNLSTLRNFGLEVLGRLKKEKGNEKNASKKLGSSFTCIFKKEPENADPPLSNQNEFPMPNWPKLIKDGKPLEEISECHVNWENPRESQMFITHYGSLQCLEKVMKELHDEDPFNQQNINSMSLHKLKEMEFEPAMESAVHCDQVEDFDEEEKMLQPSKGTDFQERKKKVAAIKKSKQVENMKSRIKQGPRVDDLFKGIVESHDEKGVPIALEYINELMNFEVSNNQLLGKRSQNRHAEEEHETSKFLRTKEGEPKLASKRKDRKPLSQEKFELEEEIDDENQEEDQEEEEEEEEEDILLKKKRKRDSDPEGEDLLSNSLAFYNEKDYFNKTIRALSRFKREIKAFQDTLSENQIEEVENAMDSGFNPVYYIMNFKQKRKTLKQIQSTIKKKDFKNSRVLQIVYDYLVKISN